MLSSGSGSTALVFTYTVKPGDNVGDLEATAIALNGGSIQSGGTNSDLSGFATIDTGVQLDTTAPTVSYIDRASGSPNNASSDKFTVTFSEDVTGVDASDFSTTTTGVSYTGITESGSGSVYTVTVSGVTGDGTLGLNLKSSGTGIADEAGNAISGGFTGETYTIEHTPPAVTAIATVGASPNNASSDAFTVTSSEAVTGVTAADFAAATTGTVADSGLTVAGGGTTYTVTVDGVTGDGTLGLNYDSGVTGVQDAAGNSATAGFTGETYTIEHTPPAVTALATVGVSPNNASSDAFTVTFSEAVTGVAADDFATATTGTVADTGLTVTGSGTSYTVTVDGVTGDGTLGLNYDSGVTGVQDAAGNSASAGFTGQTYTIEHTRPAVTSINTTGANPNNASSDAFTVTFSEAVTGVAADDFTVATTGTVADTGLTVTGSGTGYTVTANGVTGDGTLGLDFNANSSNVTDAAGNTAGDGFTGETYTIEHTPPAVMSIDTTGASPNNASSDAFTVTFSEAVTGVAADDFATAATGTVADTGLTVTGSGTGYTVTANGVTGDGTLGLDFNSNSSNVTDAAGNSASASFTGETYTIEHTAPAVTAIATVGASPNNASSDAFTVTFSEAVTGVAADDFATATTGTVADTGLTVTGSGTTYTVTASGVTGDGTLGLDYDSGVTGVQDAAGNSASAGFTGETYTVENGPAPTINPGSPSVTFTGGGSPTVLDSQVAISAPGSDDVITGATVAIDAGFLVGDTLAFTGQNGVAGNYNAATGVLTLTGAASVADYEAALDSVQYSFEPAGGDPTAAGADTARTIAWTVTDDNGTSAPQTTDLTVAPVGTAQGDVHIVTFDGLHYDFQANGTYVLARSTASGDNFQVQIQTAAIWSDQAVSLTTAVAAQLGSDVLTFDADSPNPVAVNGAADTAISASNPIQTFSGGTLAELSPTTFQIDWNTGQSLTIQDEGDYFDTSVSLGTQNGPGSVQGLLGADTGQANDFQLANGAVLQQPLSSAALLDDMAGAWNVNGAASLFSADTSAAPEVDLGAGEQITLAGVASNNVVFENTSTSSTSQSGASVLTLMTPQEFTGSTSGMTAADEIDLAGFRSQYTSITDIFGSGAVGTATDLTLTEKTPGSSVVTSATLQLINQFANEYGLSESAYSLSTNPGLGDGTLLQIAAHS
jgi:hypothetical protein